MKYLIDGDGNVLHDGDRVYTHDAMSCDRVYGTLFEPNDEIQKQEFSDYWTVDYDDGETCIVLRPQELFKA